MLDEIHDDLLLDIIEGVWETKFDLAKFVIEDLENPIHEDFAIEFRNNDHTWKQNKIENLVKIALKDSLSWVIDNEILKNKILKTLETC